MQTNLNHDGHRNLLYLLIKISVKNTPCANSLARSINKYFSNNKCWTQIIYLHIVLFCKVRHLFSMIMTPFPYYYWMYFFCWTIVNAFRDSPTSINFIQNENIWIMNWNLNAKLRSYWITGSSSHYIDFDHNDI